METTRLDGLYHFRDLSACREHARDSCRIIAPEAGLAQD